MSSRLQTNPTKTEYFFFGVVSFYKMPFPKHGYSSAKEKNQDARKIVSQIAPRFSRPKRKQNRTGKSTASW